MIPIVIMKYKDFEKLIIIMPVKYPIIDLSAMWLLSKPLIVASAITNR